MPANGRWDLICRLIVNFQVAATCILFQVLFLFYLNIHCLMLLNYCALHRLLFFELQCTC